MDDDTMENVTGGIVTKCVHALNTELPENMIPTIHTLRILGRLERRGAVYFQVDGSGIMYETIRQLKKICGNVGYDMNEAHGGFVIFNSDRIELDI